MEFMTWVTKVKEQIVNYDKDIAIVSLNFRT